jgi:pimeloyl-ACP methyl ester carboxylesterase
VSDFLSYDGTRLHYERVGQGRPLVCLAGGPGRASAYLEELAGLSDQRSLVLLDGRATGRSELPADPASLRFDRLALDLEALRDHLCLDALDVLAHSAGTLVAQTWAASHPHRVGRLVLVTPTAFLQGVARNDVTEIRAARAGEPWYADAAGALDALEDARPSERAALERALRPFWYGRWDERCQEHAASADAQTSKRAMLGFATDVTDAERDSLVSALSAVAAPVLVVAGDVDGLTGVESARAVAAAFPQSRLEVLAAAGHFPWVDQPEAFHSVVAGFLATM